MKGSFLNYFDDIKTTLDNLDLDSIVSIARCVFGTLENRKEIFTMGNGGSGSTASHFVGDLNKSARFKNGERFRAICLNDNMAILSAYANDMSYSDIFIEQLKNFMYGGDVVIGFSGSGNSKNVLNAIKYANNNEGITIGFSGFDGGILSLISKYSIIVPINDMQKCEDVHLILCHLIMKTLI